MCGGYYVYVHNYVCRLPLHPISAYVYTYKCFATKFYPLGDKKPLMRHIDSHVVKRLSSKWKELGSQLNISEHVIKRIDSAYPNDCERCCRIVFHEWLQEPACVTWEVLISAVDKVTDNVTGLYKISVICLRLENLNLYLLSYVRM